jgi:hypothetical protein
MVARVLDICIEQSIKGGWRIPKRKTWHGSFKRQSDEYNV